MQNLTTFPTNELSTNPETKLNGFIKWSQLSDVDDVDKFSESDTECLQELREVLKKYKQLDRFGITLLHKHFEIGDDEVLLETTNIKKRTQFVRPVKIKDLEAEGMSFITTSLKMVEGTQISAAALICTWDQKEQKHWNRG